MSYPNGNRAARRPAVGQPAVPGPAVPGPAETTVFEPVRVPPPLRRRDRDAAAPPRDGWSVAARSGGPPSRPAPSGPRLRVDWPNCKGHGLCTELLPEVIRLDEWGFPIISGQAIPAHLVDDARRAVSSCPTLALRLIEPS